MESTILTLKKVRSQALDAGVKIAVENHAGDMHSRELVELIERTGPEFVGATIDTGNSTWTLEDPVETFRNLAPYAVCSGIRDSMIWPSEKGVKVQWTAMGDGCVDLKRFSRNGVPLARKLRFILKQFPVLPENSLSTRRASGSPTPPSGRMTFLVSFSLLKRASHLSPSFSSISRPQKSSAGISAFGT